MGLSSLGSPLRKDKMTEQQWQTMERKRFLYFGRYMRRIADKLGLRDWYFEVQRLPLAYDSANSAEVRPTYGQKHAVVKLCWDFNSETPERQRMVLVHELIHCHLHGIVQPGYYDEAAWKILGSSAADVLRDQMHLANEFATDALARAIAPLMPLPKMEKTMKKTAPHKKRKKHGRHERVRVQEAVPVTDADPNNPAYQVGYERGWKAGHDHFKESETAFLTELQEKKNAKDIHGLITRRLSQ